MVDTDSEYKPKEFLYEYDPEKGFDYDMFVKLSTNAMYDFFEDTDAVDLQTENGTPMDIDISDTNYDREIEEMFLRLGIRALNHKKNIVFVKPMTYINAVVSYTVKDHKGRDEEQLGIFPLALEGMIYIYPKGLQVFT